MKLCVFPNDPIIAYYQKGEIKNRYFNPANFFDEIHIISFIEKDVDESKVISIGGKAKLKIHSIGKSNYKNRTKDLPKIIELVRTINPDVIRAYNPRLEGWFAANCSKSLKVPFFLSLHTQHDYNRKLAKKSNLKKFFALKYTEKFIEPFVLKSAQKITIVFKIIEPYVLRHVTKKPEILYNRINLNQFESATPIQSLPSPLIISVGNLIKEKNHECLIKAIKNLNVHLMIIGDGPEYENLTKLIQKENLNNNVIIKKSVPHSEIQNYYKSALLFALAYDPNLEGLPMPVIEAMATGLPVVIPKPVVEFSDGLEDVAVFTERTPEMFSEKIQTLLKDSNMYSEISKKSQIKAREFDGKKIEKREKEIYEELIKNERKFVQQ